MRRPRRRAGMAKVVRLFARGWDVRLLARWYRYEKWEVEWGIRASLQASMKGRE